MKKLIRMTGILMLIAMMILMAGCGGNSSSSDEQASDQTQEQAAEQTQEQAEPAAEPIGIHHAEIEIADYGTIKVELDGDTAPITVQNFMDLANAGFYDGLTFHRIIDGFMIQGGDPMGTGMGGSDKNIKGEFEMNGVKNDISHVKGVMGGSDKNIKGEFEMNGVKNDISHVKGVISMARAQDPDSASSQFFITVDDATFLDGQYAGFGHVTEGQDVADKIAAEAQTTDDNGTVLPENQPKITAIRIID